MECNFQHKQSAVATAAIKTNTKVKNMKTIKILLTAAMLAGLAAGTMNIYAADTNSPAGATNSIVKPYPLDFCLVSGDKIGGDMGAPITTNYMGQEIKFCCKDCVKDFRKDPAKYMKKLQEAEKESNKK
jgi:YHS domain-containing protein